MQYNHEDCLALKQVTDFLCRIQEIDATGVGAFAERQIRFVEKIKPVEDRRKWGQMKPAVEDFGHIIRCAYFDYQTSKVYIRTNPKVRIAARRKQKTSVERLYIGKQIDIFQPDAFTATAGRFMRAKETV